MALFLFTKAIIEDQPIQVFNNGNMFRDFTYIDDIIEGVVRVVDIIPEPNREWSGHSPDPGTSPAPHRLYNIGSHNPVRLMDFIAGIESILGKEARKEYQPMQPGDVPGSYADVADLVAATGFKPATPVEAGIRSFVEWYLEYYGIENGKSASDHI